MPSSSLPSPPSMASPMPSSSLRLDTCRFESASPQKYRDREEPNRMPPSSPPLDLGIPPNPRGGQSSSAPMADDHYNSSSAAVVGTSVIPIVNKMQDIFAQLGSSSTIDLP
ncbi:hypothetical protein ACQJBY_059384 [Aegilops geniculata]